MKKPVRISDVQKNGNPIDMTQIDSAFPVDDAYNSFYDSVSVIFRIISFVLFAVLLIFIVSSAFVSAESFSYKNMEHIIRNFALTLEENRDSSRQPIRYNPDPQRNCALFGRGLAVSGGSGVLIYSGTGRLTATESYDYRNPVMVASDKYVLVYDEGHSHYTLFNSFSAVHSSECSGPINRAIVANNGYYALVTSSDEYNSVVEVYNADFNIVNRFNINDYVISVDMTESEIMILSVSATFSANDFELDLLVSDIGASSARNEITLHTGFPLGCKLTGHGWSVICSDSALFFDSEGVLTGEFVYGNLRVYDYVAGDQSTLLLFKNDGFDIEYDVICVNMSGNVLYEYKLNETVFDIELFDSYSYILTAESVICVSGSKTVVVEVDTADYGCKLLAVDGRYVYFCSDNSAELLDLSGS